MSSFSRRKGLLRILGAVVLLAVSGTGCFKEPKVDASGIKQCKSNDNCPSGFACVGNGTCCKSANGQTCDVGDASSSSDGPVPGQMDSGAADAKVSDVANSAGDVPAAADVAAPDVSFTDGNSVVADIPLPGTGGAGGSGFDGGGVGGAVGSGGATGTGVGGKGSGGIVGSGGLITSSGGSLATGGTPGSGGAVGTGGVASSGGIVATGGANSTGGIVGTGGTTATGGTTTAATISDLVAGRVNTCARKSDGSVWCWGDAVHGVLGSLATSTVTATKIGGTGTSVFVAVGQYHACSLKTDGTVACWGSNNKGQIGNGTTGTTPITSAATVSSLSGVVSVGAGEDISCAVLNTGNVRCWGNNSWGGLANTSVTDYATSPVSASLGGVSAIAMHSNHSCALLNSGSVRCWGNNMEGQLGTTVTSMTQAADPIYVPNITTAIAVTVGWSQSCALLANQTVWCWGSQRHGLLGNGTSDDNIVSPTPVQAVGITTATAIACGGLNCCALLANATAKCWGYSDFGQVGDGTTVDRSTPTLVLTGLGSPLTNVSDIAVGGFHSCALTSSGEVYCWGQSTNYANGAANTSTNLTYATRI